ncbi:MAG: hypothetical protein GY765_01910 [bacterium]|nr:hypothetical protein [bacterium]
MNNAQGGILPTGCIVTNCCKSEQKKCVVSVLFCQATINCQKDSIDAVSFCYA